MDTDPLLRHPQTLLPNPVLTLQLRDLLQVITQPSTSSLTPTCNLDIRQVESKSASQAVERAGKAVVGSSRSLEKAEGAAEKLRREAEKTLQQVSSPGEPDTNPSRTWPLSQATAAP